MDADPIKMETYLGFLTRSRLGSCQAQIVFILTLYCTLMHAN